jgi:menaquinone-specific isochorismate synthase
MTRTGPLRSRTLPLAGPVDLLATLPVDNGYAWVREGTGFVAWGEAARLEPGVGTGRFARAAESAAALLRDIRRGGGDVPGPLVVGSFTFASGAPGSGLTLPAVVVRWTGEHAWVTVSGAADIVEGSGDGAAVLEALSDPGDPRWSFPDPGGTGGGASAPKSDDDWMAAVASARDAIRKGDLLKVVLARDVVVERAEPFSAKTIATSLALRYPECYTFICDGMVGASPELLVRREGPTLQSLTLAGSARRGEDPVDDRALGVGLLRSHKDRWEHELAVRFVRGTLSRCCSELWVDPEPFLLRLANVQHLATNLHGLLTEPLSAIELAGRLHPGAAICGTPTREALEVIARLEGMDRGHYAAPVGWMDAAGDGEWAIALRCAEVTANRARLFAGAGIVGESDPASELEETRLKLRPVLSALESVTPGAG